MHAPRQQFVIGCYAFAGGFADASSYVLYKTFTGHVTGNLILLMIAVAERNGPGAAQRLLAIVCFLAFTLLGFRMAHLRRSSVWLFLSQAALLSGSLLFHPPAVGATLLGIAVFCCSLGLQNGVVTSALGVSIHSTFVSGDFTSLLKSTGAASSETTPSVPAAQDTKKRHVLMLIIATFALGAFAAASLAHGHAATLPLLLLVPLFFAMLAQML